MQMFTTMVFYIFNLIFFCSWKKNPHFFDQIRFVGNGCELDLSIILMGFVIISLISCCCCIFVCLCALCEFVCFSGIIFLEICAAMKKGLLINIKRNPWSVQLLLEVWRSECKIAFLLEKSSGHIYLEFFYQQLVWFEIVFFD